MCEKGDDTWSINCGRKGWGAGDWDLAISSGCKRHSDKVITGHPRLLHSYKKLFDGHVVHFRGWAL